MDCEDKIQKIDRSVVQQTPHNPRYFTDASLNKTNPPAPGRSGTSFTVKSTLYRDFKINCALVGSHGMEEQCLRRLPHQGTKGGRPCYLSPGAILFTQGHCCSHMERVIAWHFCSNEILIKKKPHCQNHLHTTIIFWLLIIYHYILLLLK